MGAMQQLSPSMQQLGPPANVPEVQQPQYPMPGHQNQQRKQQQQQQQQVQIPRVPSEADDAVLHDDIVAIPPTITSPWGSPWGKLPAFDGGDSGDGGSKSAAADGAIACVIEDAGDEGKDDTRMRGGGSWPQPWSLQQQNQQEQHHHRQQQQPKPATQQPSNPGTI